MVYSFTTYSKQGRYFYISFENCMEDSSFLLKFLPTVPCPFSADNIDLPHIRMRDPESILALFEDYGITLILEGLI